MKQPLSRSEIRPCDLCECSLNDFEVYRITVEKHVLDPGALQQVMGLEMMMGGTMKAAQVAAALSPVRDFSAVSAAETYIVCSKCFKGMEEFN